MFLFEADATSMLKDKRSGKVALVSHCILNQNSRVLGLAKRPSIVNEIVQFLVHNEIGVIQMPCPELAYAGILRPLQTKEQYDNVIYRRHCRKIAEEFAKQVQEYRKCGVKLKFVLGVDGSPSCGVNETSGIFMEELRSALDKRAMLVAFFEVNFEHLKRDIIKLEKLAKSEC